MAAKKAKAVVVEPEVPTQALAPKVFNVSFLRRHGQKTVLFIQKLIMQKETEFLSPDGRKISVQVDFNPLAVNKWKREDKFRTYVWTQFTKLRGTNHAGQAVETKNEIHNIFIIPIDAEITISYENKFDHSVNRIQASLDACNAEKLLTVTVEDLTGNIIS